MDCPLKIAVVVFSVCLVVALVSGLCMLWGIALPQGAEKIPGTAVLVGIGAGFYIAIRDAIHRIKRG
jgi:4-hydroxybenzoate polyprenyltransferase